MYRNIALCLTMILLTAGSVSAQDARESSKDKQIKELERKNRELSDAIKTLKRSSRSPFGSIPAPEAVPAVATVPGALSPTTPALIQATPGSLVQLPRPTTAGGLSRFPTAVRWAKSKKELENENKIAELVQSISEAEGDSEKESLKADLKKQLESQYDQYLDKMEAPLKEMEARLDKLREEFQKRKEARDELVKLRLDNFWYQANGMTWPGDSSGRLRTTGTTIFTTQPGQSNLRLKGQGFRPSASPAPANQNSGQ